MGNLETHIKMCYAPLIRINEKKQIVETAYGGGMYVNHAAIFDALPASIIDKESLLLAEIYGLHNAVDHTATAVGSATLFRSLMQPLTSLELILAKQESVKELEADDRLRNAVAEYLGEFRNRENALFKFVNKEIHRNFPHEDFKAAMKAGKNILKAAENIPAPQSEYAQSLIDDIMSFGHSPVYRLMEGPIYRTFKGLKSGKDVGFFTPAWRFRPSMLSVGTFGPFLSSVALVGAAMYGLIDRDSQLAKNAPLLLVASAYWCAIYGSHIKPRSDHRKVILPLREKTANDPLFNLSVDSIGKIDELMSFIDFRKAMPHDTVLPAVTDGPVHYFTAQDLRNPVLAKEDPEYVAVTASLEGVKLTFISGPNSGGKTTWTKSVFQNQVLGQIGSYVAASGAGMNIADMMAYQYYVPDRLQNEEGDFGENLRRTKEIFFRTSPRSLVVLNTLASGTTFEEEMETSNYVLEGFHAIGNNTLVVTHNHSLADMFREQGKGQYLQTGFDGEAPTYRMVEGISRKSHARRTAEKVGFSEQDVKEHLTRQGYPA